MKHITIALSFVSLLTVGGCLLTEPATNDTAWLGTQQNSDSCYDSDDPRVHHVSESAEECSLSLIECQAGQTVFVDDCGCGCLDDSDVEPLDCSNGGEPCPDGYECLATPCAPGGVCQSICSEKTVEQACYDADNPSVHHVSESIDECSQVLIECQSGQTVFVDDCGCGCLDDDIELPDCSNGGEPCPDGYECLATPCAPGGVCQSICSEEL